MSSLLAHDPINPITQDTPARSTGKMMVENEISTLDSLISVTEKNLLVQQQLKKKIGEYQTMQAKYMENTDNAELLFKVARSAKSILADIEENHLTHNFGPEFMKEIQLFAQVAKKRGIPKAR
jgi:hypothetical protein